MTENATATATGAPAITGTWVIDSTHTVIGFHARHAMIAKVRGKFTEVEGTFVIDGDDIATSSAALTISSASITTDNADRDAHLKSADFLDVEAFPTLTFTSTSATQAATTTQAAGTFTLTGDLTIRGLSKRVTVEFELIGTSTDPWGGHRIGFEGTAVISRKEFGLVWNTPLETGGVLISDHVTLVLDVEAVKQ